jgi:hypothetical protein
MNHAHAKQAIKLLQDTTDRTEIMGIDGGGYCVTAVWLDGFGQRIFYALSEVHEHLAEGLN